MLCRFAVLFLVSTSLLPYQVKGRQCTENSISFRKCNWICQAPVSTRNVFVQLAKALMWVLLFHHHSSWFPSGEDHLESIGTLHSCTCVSCFHLCHCIIRCYMVSAGPEADEASSSPTCPVGRAPVGAVRLRAVHRHCPFASF